MIPNRIESWHGRPGRLHDRFGFARADPGWSTPHRKAATPTPTHGRPAP
ncbi:MAG TPA: hypothetical protein DFR83_12670 [Deltaproteobacteria bacterium]|nr:hypothetical protein [Deltaproteobacteria bacterium]